MNFRLILVLLMTLLTGGPSYGSAPSPAQETSVPSLGKILDGQIDHGSIECSLTPDQLTPLQTPSALELRARFIQAKDQILDVISASGLQQIAGQSLQAIRDKMAKIEPKVYPRLCEREMIERTVSYRGSAQWWRTSDAAGIRISASDLMHGRPELLPALSLHEFLGAIGLQDQWYECSSTLWMLARPDVMQSIMTENELTLVRKFTQSVCGHPEQHESEPQVDRLHLAGGSSSGVGGGGDERAIESKMLFVLRSLSLLARLPQNPRSRADKENRSFALSDLANQLNSISSMGNQDFDGNQDDETAAAAAAGQQANLVFIIIDSAGNATPMRMMNLQDPVCMLFNGRYCDLTQSGHQP